MKRAVLLGVVVLAIGAAIVVAGWAYQHQVWHWDDYDAGYKYGSTLPQTRQGTPCLDRAQTLPISPEAQYVFNGGCRDATKGKVSDPKRAGGYVSDGFGLWGPFG